jgi:hypothetical protein
MFLFSILIYKKKLLKSWVAWLGFVASAIYLLAQTELFHTVIPTFKVVDMSGLVGSVLWIVWFICIGVLLIVEKNEAPTDVV